MVYVCTRYFIQDRYYNVFCNIVFFTTNNLHFGQYFISNYNVIIDISKIEIGSICSLHS